MFNNEIRTYPRAYVGAGLGPTGALKIALTWAKSQVGSWSEISILVPRISDIAEDEVLANLRRAGVHFSQPRHHSANSSRNGPWVAHCPARESLLDLEKENSKSSLVVTVWSANDVRAWVNAYEPECLGGDVITPVDPKIANPVFWKAMDDFTLYAYGGRTVHDTRDSSRIIDGLKKLKSSGHLPKENEVLSAALKKNWQGGDAAVLAGYAGEILKGVNKRVRQGYTLPDDVVRRWETELQ